MFNAGVNYVVSGIVIKAHAPLKTAGYAVFFLPLIFFNKLVVCYPHEYRCRMLDAFLLYINSIAALSPGLEEMPPPQASPKI